MNAAAVVTEMKQQTRHERGLFGTSRKPDIEESAAPPVFDICNFALNGTSEEMESKMLEDKFVLGRLAILGQSTVFYAKPNAGKTLLVIWLLCDAIKRGEMDGKDIFYINADDTHKGLVHKLRRAERYGFQMLAPGYKGFRADHLAKYLDSMIQTDAAKGRILILDTVKKFTDLMRKDVASKFGEAVRQFVAHGGTIISLAHVNKHRDGEGKVVFGGTSDLVDDADCAYTLDVVTEDKATGQRTVVFENFKSRGGVAREAFYRYDYADGTSYHDRLESVVAVSDTERREAQKLKKRAAILEKNKPAITAIKECINEGINHKTALVKEASERAGIAKAKITKALEEHTGGVLAENQFWHVVVGDKNSHVYHLNYGVS